MDKDNIKIIQKQLDDSMRGDIVGHWRGLSELLVSHLFFRTVMFPQNEIPHRYRCPRLPVLYNNDIGIGWQKQPMIV